MGFSLGATSKGAEQGDHPPGLLLSSALTSDWSADLWPLPVPILFFWTGWSTFTNSYPESQAFVWRSGGQPVLAQLHTFIPDVTVSFYISKDYICFYKMSAFHPLCQATEKVPESTKTLLNHTWWHLSQRCFLVFTGGIEILYCSVCVPTSWLSSGWLCSSLFLTPSQAAAVKEFVWSSGSIVQHAQLNFLRESGLFCRIWGYFWAATVSEEHLTIGA